MPLIDDLHPRDRAGVAAPDRRADRRPDALAALEQHALQQQVRAAVHGLPPLYRSAVTLYYLEEMSVAEVAAAMDIPAGIVKSYLFRAREHLRTLLAE